MKREGSESADEGVPVPSRISTLALREEWGGACKDIYLLLSLYLDGVISTYSWGCFFTLTIRPYHCKPLFLVSCIFMHHQLGNRRVLAAECTSTKNLVILLSTCFLVPRPSTPGDSLFYLP